MGHLRVKLRFMSMVDTGNEVVDTAGGCQLTATQSSPLENVNRLSSQVAAGRGVAIAAGVLEAGEAQSMSGPAKRQTGLKTCEDCRTPL